MIISTDTTNFDISLDLYKRARDSNVKWMKVEEDTDALTHITSIATVTPLHPLRDFCTFICQFFNRDSQLKKTVNVAKTLANRLVTDIRKFSVEGVTDYAQYKRISDKVNSAILGPNIRTFFDLENSIKQEMKRKKIELFQNFYFRKFNEITAKINDPNRNFSIEQWHEIESDLTQLKTIVTEMQGDAPESARHKSNNIDKYLAKITNKIKVIEFNTLYSTQIPEITLRMDEPYYQLADYQWIAKSFSLQRLQIAAEELRGFDPTLINPKLAQIEAYKQTVLNKIDLQKKMVPLERHKTNLDLEDPELYNDILSFKTLVDSLRLSITPHEDAYSQELLATIKMKITTAFSTSMGDLSIQIDMLQIELNDPTLSKITSMKDSEILTELTVYAKEFFQYSGTEDRVISFMKDKYATEIDTTKLIDDIVKTKLEALKDPKEGTKKSKQDKILELHKATFTVSYRERLRQMNNLYKVYQLRRSNFPQIATLTHQLKKEESNLRELLESFR